MSNLVTEHIRPSKRSWSVVPLRECAICSASNRSKLRAKRIRCACLRSGNFVTFFVYRIAKSPPESVRAGTDENAERPPKKRVRTRPRLPRGIMDDPLQDQGLADMLYDDSMHILVPVPYSNFPAPVLWKFEPLDW